jgi:carbon monoxide dehydrogenase subunit G
MATNETYVDASPEAVWSVLADPFAYPGWVVGSKRTVWADPDWPRAGAEFRVRVGVGPLALPDRTVCRSVRPRRHIALHAGGGGVAGADVDITLKPQGSGTHVTLVERPGGISAPLRKLLPLQMLIHVRNAESLRRFKALAERAAAS